MNIDNRDFTDEIEEDFKGYFNYAITSFVSMITNLDVTTSAKFSIGALLRHTPNKCFM
jgi:hypothetical protein